MKAAITVLAVAAIGSTEAFAPNAQPSRASTALFAEEKKSFFSTIFDMDLFAPDAGVNDYGARSNKKVGVHIAYIYLLKVFYS
mmetsp:Transcript_13240/g.29163  ORF Transcript_13240/g.29163 Transcript_13240/m.29163 type:complete len:83 (+) Transcript_13240:24-272(+)